MIFHTLACNHLSKERMEESFLIFLTNEFYYSLGNYQRQRRL